MKPNKGGYSVDKTETERYSENVNSKEETSNHLQDKADCKNMPDSKMSPELLSLHLWIKAYPTGFLKAGAISINSEDKHILCAP